MKLLLAVAMMAALAAAAPEGRNLAQMPIVCPSGMMLDHMGKCRAMVRSSDDVNGYNVIDVPVECPEGQAPDPNGKCRPVWPMNVGLFGSRNIVSGHPIYCPPGQKPDLLGKCRPIVQFVISFLKALMS